MDIKIKIENNLFQWERDREVFIDFDKTKYPTLYAQIFNAKTVSAPLIPLADNRIFIPDEVLELSIPITVLICSESKVVARKEFCVLKRPKPTGYNNTYQVLEKINNLIGGDI